jgi:hypothetical protein
MRHASIIHQILYGKLRKYNMEIHNGNIINITEIYPITKWTVRIPKKYQYEIVKELVECGFLKKISRDDYEIPPVMLKKPVYDGSGNPLW